jgi:glucose/mannose-6-phosphate isomerase
MVAEAGRAVEALDSGRRAGAAVELPFPPEAVRDVAVCGMGGSAIAGDLVSSVYAPKLRRPMGTLREYYLPSWVGENTLVFLMSYSGNTEETLTAAMQAVERGCLIVAVTSGGKLESFYGGQGVPVVPVPPGLQPRAALLHLLVPMVVVLSRLGVIPPVDADLDDARSVLANGVAAYGPSVAQDQNPAKQVAAALEGGVPLVYGAESTAAVARRWKTQINENAKFPAFAGELPEADHNEIAGWGGAGEASRLSAVFLEDRDQHPRVRQRFDLTAKLVEADATAIARVETEGESRTERLLWAVMLGDLLSLQLAARRGVDPSPVEAIERLKDELGRSE